MKIVIADTEETVIEEIIRVLENSKVEYKLEGTTDNSKEGYELIKAVRPDLVIMDVRLEGSDGLAMMKKLRAEGVASKLIILTEDTDFNTAREAIETGTDSYLLKPIEAALLEKELLKISGRLAEEKAAITYV